VVSQAIQPGYLYRKATYLKILFVNLLRVLLNHLPTKAKLKGDQLRQVSMVEIKKYKIITCSCPVSTNIYSNSPYYFFDLVYTLIVSCNNCVQTSKPLGEVVQKFQITNIKLLSNQTTGLVDPWETRIQYINSCIIDNGPKSCLYWNQTKSNLYHTASLIEEFTA